MGGRTVSFRSARESPWQPDRDLPVLPLCNHATFKVLHLKSCFCHTQNWEVKFAGARDTLPSSVLFYMLRAIISVCLCLHGHPRKRGEFNAMLSIRCFSLSLGLMRLFTQAGIIKAAAALGSAAIPRQTNSSYWA